MSSVHESLAARGSRLASLRTVGREALAFARLASLLHRDTSPVLPHLASTGDDVVVLLHGLFATAGVLRPLRTRLEAETGAHVASFTYEPGPGVDELAGRLGRLLERMPEGVRIHLVGHSMGGIVIRWYVQLHDGGDRVVQTISLGTPFSGTPRARIMFGAAGSDIVPDSVILKRLQQTAGGGTRVPHLSITGSDDVLAGPDVALPVGGHVLIPDCGHNGLLYDERSTRHVVRRVTEFRRAI